MMHSNGGGPWRGRPKRNTAATTPNEEASTSGISGPPVVEEPPDPDKPTNFRERWKRIRDSVRGTFLALPRAFRLVWEPSPSPTVPPPILPLPPAPIPPIPPLTPTPL